MCHERAPVLIGDTVGDMRLAHVEAPQVRERLGYDWSIFEDGVAPGDTPGETVEEVAARASRVVRRALAALHDGDVALVGHGHCLRVLATVFLRREPRMGAQLLLDAGSVSVLEFERGQPAIRVWNHGPAVTAGHAG